MQIYSKDLLEQVRDAKTAYQAGHFDYARDQLQHLTQACIQCHSRTSKGPSFTNLPFDQEKLGLKSIEAAEFFAATRQFDRALSELNQLIESATFAKNEPWKWMQAVSDALLLSVRVKQDVALTQAIILNVQKNNHAPFFVKKDAQSWEKSALAWKKEGKIQSKGAVWNLIQGKKFFNQAKSAQKYLRDRSADILYLRSTAFLHQYLEQAGFQISKEDHALSLWMLGEAYEALQLKPIGTNSGSFFEACIRVLPKSKIAEKCFVRFEQVTLAGFTGSAGLDLPADVSEKIKQLKTMTEKSHP